MAKRPLRRAYPSFSLQMEDIVTVSEKRMLAVVRQSLQDVIINASQSTAKGGRMRVDTGFLRASGQASLTGMPTGPTRGELKAKGAYKSADDYSVTVSVSKSLSDLELGSTFFFGWTAAYARYRELYDGFLEGALQHFDRYVAFNTDTVRQRVKK